MTVKHWIALALVLGLVGACDYTPEQPNAPTPSPTPTAGAVVVVVVPVLSPAPTVSPIPPVPLPSGSAFTIVLATPPEHSTINVTDSSVAAVHRPTLDFEFRYPQNLTLDDDFTNIEIGLLLSSKFGTSYECLHTDLGHSIRLDRDDTVYVANSVALFRTGIWHRMYGAFCNHEPPSSFTTDQVRFLLTPDVSQPFQVATFLLPMQWDFVVQ